MARKMLRDPAVRGRLGGKARLRTMTVEERRQSARRAVMARWKRTSKAERQAAARRAIAARWAKARRA